MFNPHTQNNSSGTILHDIELYERFIQFLLKENTEKGELIRQLLNSKASQKRKGGGYKYKAQEKKIK